MNIYQSIANIMQDIPAIGKDKVNSQQHFKFRGIDDVMNVMQPILAKHKVFIVPQMLEQIREERVSKTGGNLIYSICKIKFMFYAEDGTFVEAITTGEGMDSGDKATNKAMAIAMKYALFQVFCIPTEEMNDPDADTPEPSQPVNQTINPEIESALRKMIINHKKSDEEVKEVLKELKHEKLNELKVSEVVKFRKLLEVD